MNQETRTVYANQRIKRTGSRDAALRTESTRLVGTYAKSYGAAMLASSAIMGATVAGMSASPAVGVAIALGTSLVGNAAGTALGVHMLASTVRTIRNKQAIRDAAQYNKL